MDCTTYLDLVAADADGRLAPAEQAAAEAHVAACPRCAQARRVQGAVASLLRQRRLVHPAPAALRERIERASTGPAAGATLRRLGRWRTRVVLAGAVAAGLALLILPRQFAQPDLLTVLVDDVRAAESNAIAFDRPGDDFTALNAFYRARLDLDEPLIDLRPAGFHLAGGTIDAIGTIPTALAVYEGKDGLVVCRRFRAGSIDLPAGGRQVGGARFFEVDGVAIRVEQIGDTICCTAGAMPLEAMIRLFTMPDAPPPSAQQGRGDQRRAA